MSHDPIAYTYEADVHCPDCAMERFPACEEHGQIACCVEDGEGNEPGAIFPWDEEPDGLVCGDCHVEIVEHYEEIGNEEPEEGVTREAEVPGGARH